MQMRAQLEFTLDINCRRCTDMFLVVVVVVVADGPMHIEHTHKHQLFIYQFHRKIKRNETVRSLACTSEFREL